MLKDENFKKMQDICNEFKKLNWNVDYKRENDCIASFDKHLNGIKYGFNFRMNEYKNNIEVSSSTIRSPIDSYYWYVDYDSINIGFQKSVETIVKDIQRRFMSDFQIKADEYVQTAVRHVEYVTKRRNVMQQACKILGFKDYQPNSETQTGYFKNNSSKTYVKIQSYGDGLKIEIDTISIEQLKKIAEVLK